MSNDTHDKELTLCDTATTGDWSLGKSYEQSDPGYYIYAADGAVVCASQDDSDCPLSEADARFIAHFDPPRVRALLEHNARLDAWVTDLLCGMYVNCVYCGHRYGPSEDTPTSMADVLKEHIEQCPQHPMSKLKREVEELRTRMQRQADAQQMVDAVMMRAGIEDEELV